MRAFWLMGERLPSGKVPMDCFLDNFIEGELAIFVGEASSSVMGALQHMVFEKIRRHHIGVSNKG